MQALLDALLKGKRGVFVTGPGVCIPSGIPPYKHEVRHVCDVCAQPWDVRGALGPHAGFACATLRIARCRCRNLSGDQRVNQFKRHDTGASVTPPLSATQDAACALARNGTVDAGAIPY